MHTCARVCARVSSPTQDSYDGRPQFGAGHQGTPPSDEVPVLRAASPGVTKPSLRAAAVRTHSSVHIYNIEHVPRTEQGRTRGRERAAEELRD